MSHLLLFFLPSYTTESLQRMSDAVYSYLFIAFAADLCDEGKLFSLCVVCVCVLANGQMVLPAIFKVLLNCMIDHTVQK